MKTLTFVILSLLVCAMTVFGQSQYATVDDLNNLYRRITDDLNKLYQKSVEDNNGMYTALKKSDGNDGGGVIKQQVIQLIHKYAVSMPEFAPNGKYNQLARKVNNGNGLNGQVDNSVHTADDHARLGKLEETSRDHDEQIKAIKLDLFRTQLAVVDEETLVQVTVNGEKSEIKAGDWARNQIKAKIKKQLSAALDKARESDKNTDQTDQ